MAKRKATASRTREAMRAYYAKNREKLCAYSGNIQKTDKARLKRKQRRAAVRAFFHSYKAERGCIDCGEGDPAVLDFDHRDPKQKSFCIGRSAADLKIETFLIEIEKCDVRCANCHRRRTYNQRQAGEI